MEIHLINLSIAYGSLAFGISILELDLGTRLASLFYIGLDSGRWEWDFLWLSLFLDWR